MNRGLAYGVRQLQLLFRREQKRIEQTPRRGRRLSIFGLVQPLVTFIYGLAIGSFPSAS